MGTRISAAIDKRDAAKTKLNPTPEVPEVAVASRIKIAAVETERMPIVRTIASVKEFDLIFSMTSAVSAHASAKACCHD